MAGVSHGQAGLRKVTGERRYAPREQMPLFVLLVKPPNDYFPRRQENGPN